MAKTSLDGMRWIFRMAKYASTRLSDRSPKRHLLLFESIHYFLRIYMVHQYVSCQFDYGRGSLAYRAVCVTMRAVGLLGSCWTHVDRIRTEFIAKVSRRTIPPSDPDPSCRRHIQPPHFFHLALTSRKNEYSTRCSCDLQYQESRDWSGW